MKDEEKKQRELRRELFSLINTEFAGENDRVAYVLKSLGKPVSVRTIQSWLIDPRRQSSRKVPGWVLPTLKSHLEKLSGRPYSNPVDREPAYAQFIDVHDKYALEYAEREIAREGLIQEKWANASTSKLTEMLAELELSIEKQLEDMSIYRDTVRQAMNDSDDFQEFKDKFGKYQELRLRASYVTRKAREDIENNASEFSNNEGLTS